MMRLTTCYSKYATAVTPMDFRFTCEAERSDEVRHLARSCYVLGIVNQQWQWKSHMHAQQAYFQMSYMHHRSCVWKDIVLVIVVLLANAKQTNFGTADLPSYPRA